MICLLIEKELNELKTLIKKKKFLKKSMHPVLGSAKRKLSLQKMDTAKIFPWDSFSIPVFWNSKSVFSDRVQCQEMRT